MGSVFTSPVPPVALCACWTVTGNTNNALTAPSNLSPADTSAARRAADGRGRAGCALPQLHGKKRRLLTRRSGEMGTGASVRKRGIRLRVCLHMQILILRVPWPSVYMCFMRGGCERRSGEAARPWRSSRCGSA